MMRRIASADGGARPRSARCSAVGQSSARGTFAEAAGHHKAIVINEPMMEKTEVLADLNALSVMVYYVELELERIAPGCLVAASTLRSSIVSEILARTPYSICGTASGSNA